MVQIDTMRIKVQPHHVGIDGVIQLATEIRPEFLNPLGFLMGLRELPAKKRFFDRNACWGCNDSRLPQAATNRLAYPAAALDKRGAADDDATNWRTETLAEAQ